MLASVQEALLRKDGCFFRRPFRLVAAPANIEIGGGGVFRELVLLQAMAVFFADTGIDNTIFHSFGWLVSMMRGPGVQG